MKKVTITCHLPIHLRIADGVYGVNAQQISLKKSITGDFSVASLILHVDSGNDEDENERLVGQSAKRLVNNINRLVRWYRVLQDRQDIAEITLSKASPFFLSDEEGKSWWKGQFEFESDFPPVPRYIAEEELTNQIRMRYESGNEPEVAIINISDAQHALRVGRFRESVLLCWSAIDAVFNRHFKEIAEKKLPGEWASGREFLVGNDFGLRNKMTVGLQLLVGRSFFAEPVPFWDQLSTSYQRRNKIIHDGQSAVEEDARNAITIAKRVIEILETLQI